MFKFIALTTSTVALSLFAANSAFAVNLGDFDTIDGWNRTGTLGTTNVVSNLGSTTNYNAIGNISTTTPGSATLSKTATVGSAGDLIHWTFSLRSLGYLGAGTLNAIANGITLRSFNVGPLSGLSTVSNYNLSFNSIGADNYKYSYTGTASSGFGIDNIAATATPTPEPAEYLGTLVFMGALWKIRKNLTSKKESIV